MQMSEAMQQQPNPQLQQQMEQLQGMLEQPVPSLHNITVKRSKKSGRICIENVPLDEFRISRKAKTIQDSPFVAHEVRYTASDLTAWGIKDVDSIQSNDNASSMTGVALERATYDDDTQYLNDDSNDPSLRPIWVTECYLRVDFDDDGIAEWRKVTVAGDKILEAGL